MRRFYGAFSEKAAATLPVSALSGAGYTKHQNDEAIAQDVLSKLAADPIAKSSSVSVTTKDGKQVEVPAELALTFTLCQPLTLLPGAK